MMTLEEIIELDSAIISFDSKSEINKAKETIYKWCQDLLDCILAVEKELDVFNIRYKTITYHYHPSFDYRSYGIVKHDDYITIYCNYIFRGNEDYDVVDVSNDCIGAYINGTLREFIKQRINTHLNDYTKNYMASVYGAVKKLKDHLNTPDVDFENNEDVELLKKTFLWQKV